jgi:hypothetical protein
MNKIRLHIFTPGRIIIGGNKKVPVEVASTVNDIIISSRETDPL